MITACRAWSIRRRGTRMLGKNEAPERALGIRKATSPAWVVITLGRAPLRSVVRSGVRSYRPAPKCSAASASISSCITRRTDSLTRSRPSVVRNASNNSDTADWGTAIGELLLDEYLAVHIENLAGGPL